MFATRSPLAVVIASLFLCRVSGASPRSVSNRERHSALLVEQRAHRSGKDSPDVNYDSIVDDRNLEDRDEVTRLSAGDRNRAAKSSENWRQMSGSNGGTEPIRSDRFKLDTKQLSSIYSVSCLEERQQNPHAPCLPQHLTPPNIAENPGPLNIGSFPSWRDPRCHSNGQLFCDPEGLLQENQTIAHGLTNLLADFRETTRVQCGVLESKLQDSPALLHERRFNLGVAVAYDWPETEIDADSLQKFGDLLLRQWGMLPWYNGVDAMNGLNPPITQSQSETNCPNAAVLIVLPKHHVVYTATPGCQFFCHDRGGQPVDAAVLVALEGAGLARAIEVGVAEVRAVVRMASANPNTMQSYGPRSYWRRQVSLEDKMERSEVAWVFAMRAIMALVVGISLLICTQFFWSAAGQPFKNKLERTAAAAAARDNV